MSGGGVGERSLLDRIAIEAGQSRQPPSHGGATSAGLLQLAHVGLDVSAVHTQQPDAGPGAPGPEVTQAGLVGGARAVTVAEEELSDQALVGLLFMIVVGFEQEFAKIPESHRSGVERLLRRRPATQTSDIELALAVVQVAHPMTTVPSHWTWPGDTSLTCGGPDSLRRRPAGCLTESGPRWPFSRWCLIQSGPRWPFSRQGLRLGACRMGTRPRSTMLGMANVFGSDRLR